jgi:proteasome lid subunit RPN8/RPN11
MKIRQDVLAALIAHAEKERPNECCGLLIGSDELIQEAVKARNAARSPKKFQVEPADHFAAIRRARATGLAIVGAYHSHPNGPSGPSETDRVKMSDPALIHLIVSLAGGTSTVRAFRWTEGNFSPLGLVTVA